MENDRQVCTFFAKIGACRHGDKCVRSHIRPKRSNTVVFMNLYDNPKHIKGLRHIQQHQNHHRNNSSNSGNKNADNNQQQQQQDEPAKKVDPSTGKEESQQLPSQGDRTTRNGQVIQPNINEAEVQRNVDKLYQDFFVELALKYGQVDKLAICENVNNHLSGNVYVTFHEDRAAAKCYKECNDRWYDERPCFVELSPVKNIDDATCRSYEAGHCDRGGLCNYMHIRKPTHFLERKLFKSQTKFYQDSN
ncbi:unnamed protein product [Ambrosiozyma monospora]|uniref:Unnamed protein product n=1 Tax=Ambrosiozyma monospora TaxID=43982 RepID=A0ACB5TBE3_AMBMO|nr:unnamed protein product [Ambrosiozyma monospora]